jgi:site-specific DNA-cytosine methylase
MRAIVLFAGMGGASAGLAAAGIDVCLCVDGWQRACVAHRRWHPAMPVMRARCEDAHHIAAMTVDMVWASPSCKPYSTANRVAWRRGTDHPEHYPLSLLVEQMRAWQARWLVIENVPGLVWSVEGKQELARFHQAVTGAGLVWTYTMLSAASCGVRQLRRRAIIVVGDRLVTIPDGFSGPGFGDTGPGFGDTGPGGGVLRTIMGSSPTQYIRRDNTAEGSRSAASTWEKRGKGYASTWSTGRAQRAVTGSGEGTSTVNWIGRTLAECCDLQCTPLEPLLGIPRSSAHVLVGNAVPPPMASVIGETLLRHDRRST